MEKIKKYILIINAGSATLKFKIFDSTDFSVALSGIVEKIGLPGSFIHIAENSSKRMLAKNFPEGIANHGLALEIVFSHLKHWQNKFLAIGHRVVHGGQDFTAPTMVSKKMLSRLQKYNQLAPLHNPINYACMEGCLRKFPKIKNIAVFDTAYYKTIPDYAYLYAIPYNYYQEYGIRRYGFHGISHEYVAKKASEKLGRPLAKLRLITCHLGSGCSLTAVKHGKAIETSMGFTPLEGVAMGTRCGDLDPSVAIFLMRHAKLDVDQVEDILNRKSGLLGIFGYSNDMRDIMMAAGYKVPGYKPPRIFSRADRERGRLALEVFIYRIVRYIGSYSLIMGGVDYLVFTAGIGERNADVRRLILKQVRKYLKSVKSLVIPTNEELMIARQTARAIT